MIKNNELVHFYMGIRGHSLTDNITKSGIRGRYVYVTFILIVPKMGRDYENYEQITLKSAFIYPFHVICNYFA